LSAEQLSDAELLQAIRDHWSAIENGAHHRRDVSFGEDGCGVSQRGAAQVLACLRNLALGVYELARERGQTHAPSAKSRGRQMTFSAALAWLGR
jgi:predicted transposase YbfD/YdcC